MKYKGYELLKAIANGEIKEGSLILFDSIIWIVDEYSDIVKYQKEHITLFNTYKAKEIAMSDFELIEDEIDIDSIIELEEFELDQFVTMDKSERFDRTMIEYSKINQLVQAVKQLNKKVKELKEDKHMTKEQAIEVLEKIDVKFFISGMTEQKDYIIDKADEVNVAIGTVLFMLKEKDKQIDLMANHIATSDSDLCEYLDITTKCKYYAGDNGKTCDNCIKQYFENKAKELLNK